MKSLLDEMIEFQENIIEEQIYVQYLGLEDNENVVIVGDIHSSLYSLLQILQKMKNMNQIDDAFKLINNTKMVFLGDLVDRGPFSLEILMIAFKLKLVNPDNVIILNGNHEDEETYDYYGLCTEMNIEMKESSKMLIHKILKKLPCALFVHYNNDSGGKYYQLCHGGIELNYNPKDTHKRYKKSLGLSEPIYPELRYGVSYDETGLKWSDFSISVKGFEQNLNRDPDPNGNMYIFGKDATSKYLNYNNLYSIISGHQDSFNLAILPNSNKYASLEAQSKEYEIELVPLKPSKGIQEIKLNPQGDFYALVTSTATGPKFDDYFLSKTSYLVLGNSGGRQELTAYFIDI